MSEQRNPLLESHAFPPFDEIQPAHVEPAIREILQANRATLASALEQDSFTWESLVLQLDEMDDRLGQAFSPVGHLNAVKNSPELRDAYNACLPLLSDYSTEISQNRRLYEAYVALAEDDDGSNPERGMVLRQAIRDFRLSGVALDDERKQRYGEIQRRLSELTSKFSDQVLDATQAWSKLVEDAQELDGVPDSALEMFRDNAERKQQSGYLLNLEFPSYNAVMTHCRNRSLREEMYTAYATRASDQGPNPGQWDNAPLLDEILALRHEKARLLDFESYAHYSLAPKMARSPEEVVGFLNELAERGLPAARKELQELQEFARDEFSIDELRSWDVGFVSEHLRLARHAVSEEKLRPYFPAERVINGMFTIAGQLFDIEIAAVDAFASYHPDVRLYEIRRNGSVIAWFYVDMFARENKRGGAWMDDYRSRWRQADGSLQLPVAYLTCNFNPPSSSRPSLLTHDEVTTLFHEFGHGLHHMLTRMECRDVSGIHGVPWDAVELPSQFMENWCWEREAIPLISGHYETGAPLPDEELENLLAARNFQAAMMLVRQLEFSLFDFRLHLEYNAEHPRAVLEFADEIRDHVSVLRPPAFNRYPNSFTHVFSGGYAAGYYSYKWAEVLAADAFARFRDEGVMSAACGRAFREAILEQGGSREPMDLFIEFRGREPKVDALLESCGLA